MICVVLALLAACLVQAPDPPPPATVSLAWRPAVGDVTLVERSCVTRVEVPGPDGVPLAGVTRTERVAWRERVLACDADGCPTRVHRRVLEGTVARQRDGQPPEVTRDPAEGWSFVVTAEGASAEPPPGVAAPPAPPFAPAVVAVLATPLESLVPRTPCAPGERWRIAPAALGALAAEAAVPPDGLVAACAADGSRVVSLTLGDPAAPRPGVLQGTGRLELGADTASRTLTLALSADLPAAADLPARRAAVTLRLSRAKS